MKSVLLLLGLVAACACDDLVAAAPETVPTAPDAVPAALDAVPAASDQLLSPAEWISHSLDYGNSGGYGSGYDGQYSDYSMFFVPRLTGRQGLGFQKRNYYSTAMRWPVTPEILQPIGYRPTVKEVHFQPLPQYNYRSN